MYVATIPQGKLIKENGDITEEWGNFFEVIVQALQLAVGSEGFVVPSQNNANMLIIQNGTDMNGGQIARPGTLLFNTSTVNGGSSSDPYGQLYILLKDGTFHPITNT